MNGQCLRQSGTNLGLWVRESAGWEDFFHVLSLRRYEYDFFKLEQRSPESRGIQGRLVVLSIKLTYASRCSGENLPFKTIAHIPKLCPKHYLLCEVDSYILAING